MDHCGLETYIVDSCPMVLAPYEHRLEPGLTFYKEMFIRKYILRQGNISCWFRRDQEKQKLIE